MRDWNRSTKECTLDGLHPEIAAAIHRHIQRFNLGPLLEDCRMCIETRSEKAKKGLFGKRDGQAVLENVILTSRWLIWGHSDAGDAVAQSAQLRDVVVENYRDTPGYRLIQDAGVQVTGILTGRTGEDEAQSGSAFIVLGEEPAAVQFTAALIEACQAAKR